MPKKPKNKAAKKAAGNAAKKAPKTAPEKAAKKAAKKAVARPASSSAGKSSPASSATKGSSGTTTVRLFGTDGVRARAGSAALTPERILALGRAVGAWLASQSNGKRPCVLLGVDPRPSADMVGTALAAGLTSECCDVHWPGMMSTPEVAFLTGHGPFDAGIVVTASHNESTDNGIKVFGKDGRKLPESVERKIEQAVLGGATVGVAEPKLGRFGWLQLGRERHYEEYIIKTFRKSFASLRKRPLTVVFDCAYGARSIDLQILSRLAHSLAFGKTVPEYRVGTSLNAGDEGAENALDIVFMNAANPSHPDTHNLINVNCGSLHPEGCARAVRELKADLGVCFDGDGDRCILIDETGAVRDGDFMLALLAEDMKARGVLKADTVVTTSMANLGLEEALSGLGIRTERTDVGDRYVSARMMELGAVLGGEQSGHVIISDEGNVAGDGLYTALRVIEVMLDSGKPLSALCKVKKFPQAIVNVRSHAKPPLGGLKLLAKARAEVEATLAGRGRINLRYSGTEPLLRIMVEAPDDDALQSALSKLEKAARADLG